MKYRVIKKTDSLSRVELDLPVLKLNANKTFVLSFRSRNIQGKWYADDYGDFTLIEFSEDDIQVQGKIVGTEMNPEIIIGIPEIFCCPFFEALVFKKK